MTTFDELDNYARSEIGDHGGAARPFLLGWLHGRRHQGAESAREASDYCAMQRSAGLFPVDIEPEHWAARYLNGRDDALARDCTRIAAMLAGREVPAPFEAAAPRSS